MYHLEIECPEGILVTAHASRELAHAAFLAATTRAGQRYRVAEASWSHTAYRLYDDHNADSVTVAYAVIAEACTCGHTIRRHGEAGCRVDGDTGCTCRAHRPEPTELALFGTEDVDVCLPEDRHIGARAAHSVDRLTTSVRVWGCTASHADEGDRSHGASIGATSRANVAKSRAGLPSTRGMSSQTVAASPAW
jgi:hypothetical protein